MVLSTWLFYIYMDSKSRISTLKWKRINAEKTKNIKLKTNTKILFIVFVLFGIFISALLLAGILGLSSNSDSKSIMPIERNSNHSNTNPSTSSQRSTTSISDSNLDEDLDTESVSNSDITSSSNQFVNGSILFIETDHSGLNEKLFSICPIKKIPIPITENHGENYVFGFYSSLSFDGESIVFAKKNKIFIKSLKITKNNNLDSETQMIFESESILIKRPSFSPDGKKIIFANMAGSDNKIYGIDVKKTQTTNNGLVYNKSKEVENFVEIENIKSLFDFKYTPDGKFIVCHVAKEEEGEEEDENKKKKMVSRYYLYVIDAESKQINNIIDLQKIFNTRHKEYILFYITFSISRDSSKIGFNICKNSLKNELHILNLDGTDHKIIFEEFNTKLLSTRKTLWSPDGKYILYNESRNCTRIIKIDFDSESEYDVLLMDKVDKPIEGEPLFWYAKEE